MDIYQKAGMFIEEYAVSNLPDDKNEVEELKVRYSDFQKAFSIEKLATVSSSEAPNLFMQIQNGISLIDKSYTEKVMADDNVRDAILKGTKIILNSTLETVEDYDTLHDKLSQVMGNYIQSLLIYKYFALIYPNKFALCHQIEAQTNILYSCAIVPHDKLYVRGGQLAMLSNHACMSSLKFCRIALAYFGNTKKFFKVDITNDQFDVFPNLKEKNIVNYGFKELGDLNNYVQNGMMNTEMLKNSLIKVYYPNSPQHAEIKVQEIVSFWSASFDCVYVVIQNGTVIALADALGPYVYDNYFGHTKAVTWKRFIESNTYLPISDEASGAICYPLNHKLNIQFLYQKYHNVFHVSAASSGGAAIKKMHPFNQILYGASGTGKTYSTIEMAMAIIENRPVDFNKVRDEKEQSEYRKKYEDFVEKSQITFVAFHANYTYEDFVQSINPDMSLKNGVFKRISDRAYRTTDRNFVIIIDEINRAPIAEVFGEVYSLIDDDKRKGEKNELAATLPLGDTFAVPNNLYILATVNSSNKSLTPIDTALRRRFKFIEISPNENLIQDPYLKAVFINLNDYLFKMFQGGEFLIGHSYFMNKADKDLVDILNSNIIPLLYEYLENDINKIKQILEYSAGNYVDVIGSRFGRFSVSFKQAQQQQPQQQQQVQEQQAQPQQEQQVQPQQEQQVQPQQEQQVQPQQEQQVQPQQES